MTQIVLNEQQTAALADSNGCVEFRDSAGNIVGYLEPILTEDEIAELRRRTTTPGVWYTTEQVLEHLRGLDVK